MRRTIKSIFALLIATLTLASCEQDPTIDDGDNTSSDVVISLPITITVDAMEYGTEESRSEATRATSDNDGILSEVKNLWIAQMSGMDDDSIVLAVHYIEDMGNIGTLNFIETVKSTTMVYLANTGVSDETFIERGDTLSDIKNLLLLDLTAPTSADQLYTGGLVYVDEEDEEKKEYFLMSGTEVLLSGLRETTTLTATLKRNAVKVTVNITNSWDSSTITGVTLKSAAGKTGYFLNRDDFDLTTVYPVIGEEDEYVTLDHLTTAISISDTDPIYSISFYVPANMRGTEEESTAETKPDNAPDYSTYVVISAEDSDGGGYDYTFYLGANLSTDYNLMPNYHYTYDIEFSGIGDIYNDPRIEMTAMVKDYSTDNPSNCYIINGSDDCGYTYYIPIDDRINDFWENYATSGTYTPFTADANIEDWNYETLWNDCDDGTPFAEDQLSIEKVVMSGKRCLKVIVPKGFDNWGNVVVAVKDTNEEAETLWSWHLWLTDYDPYSAQTYVSDNRSYVTGGELHRYNDSETQSPAIWGTDGIYDGKFIMDRNIGAREKTSDCNYNSSESTTPLYYQFGRKDPFSYSANGGETLNTTVTGPKDFTYSVQNPTTFITSTDKWCSEEDSSADYTWNDKKVSSTSTTGKSIFDPSPYGFRVPIYETWNDFSYPYYPSDSADDAFCYYSIGSGKYTNSAGVFYYIDSNSFSKSDCYYGYIWSSTVSDNDNGKSYNLYFLYDVYWTTGNTNYWLETLSNYQANGYQIRCVQE